MGLIIALLMALGHIISPSQFDPHLYDSQNETYNSIEIIITDDLAM